MRHGSSGPIHKYPSFILIQTPRHPSSFLPKDDAEKIRLAELVYAAMSDS